VAGQHRYQLVIVHKFRYDPAVDFKGADTKHLLSAAVKVGDAVMGVHGYNGYSSRGVGEIGFEAWAASRLAADASENMGH
jgi:hypothetical protein